MRAASSLALAGMLLGAAAQEAPPDQLRKWVEALAGDAVDARRDAEARLEELPFHRAAVVRSTAVGCSVEARAVLRSWLPHPIWGGVLDGSIGELRRRELELLGEGRAWTPAAFARAGLTLLAREGRERAAGFQLLERIPALDPAALLPFLDDPATARFAVAALGRADEALAVKEALRRLRDGPEAIARQMVWTLADLGTPETTPALIEILKAAPAWAGAVVDVLGKIGDGRAEEALIARLPVAPAEERYGLVQALSLLGGAKAVAALRSRLGALPPGHAERLSLRQALVRLRDPEASRDRIAADEWDVDLLRLGDRGLVGELVERIRAGGLKVKQRNLALELLGIVGSEEQLELLLEHLKDARFRDAAATALGELGDARAAGPLAEALATASIGAAIGKSLARVPPAGAEAALLEILGEPKAHAGVLAAAIEAAGRVGGSGIKAKLAALIADPDSNCGIQAALALGPLLAPEERGALRRRLPSKDADARAAGSLALALSGEGASLAACMEAWRDVGLRDLRGRNVAALLPLDREEWILALEREVKAHPAWVEGAVELGFRGRASALEPLLAALKTRPSGQRHRTAAALARLGHPAGLQELLENLDLYSWDPESEAVLAKALDDATAAPLRFRVWTQLNHGNQMPARVLAWRGDVEMVPYFRRALRRDYVDNAVQGQSNTPALAEALAGMGRVEGRPSFLRMLRSRASSTRALGARCLALLDGPAAIPALLPLLDDGEALPDGRRVRDAAADALQTLAGRTFEGPPRARVAAARAWASK